MCFTAPTLRPPFQYPLRGALVAAVLLGLAMTMRAETAPGTIITNQALVTARTGEGGGAVATRSNTDTIVVVPPPVSLPAAGAFLVTGNGLVRISVFRGEFRSSAGQFRPLPSPPARSAPGQPDGSVAVRFGAGSALRAGAFFLLRFVDRAADVNPLARDTILVTVQSAGGADTETLCLGETGPNTGVFAAMIVAEPIAPVPGDGRIAMPVSGTLSGDYQTVAGMPLHFEASVLVDPFGLLFDSSTGEPLDGVAVTLLDAATSKPAPVFGSDGVSVFPSTITTGLPVRDSGGATYVLPSGRYAFPKVAPGRYRLSIKLDGRSGYSVPSVVSDQALSAVPGGPFVIGVGSRGEAFAVEDQVVPLDVPADPNPNTLVVSLTAGTSYAAAGDFVRYRLTVTNQRGLRPIGDIRTEVRLPPGFRLETKSVRLAHQHAEALPAGDGQSFVLRLPPLGGGALVEGEFVARLAVPRIGRATATAVASTQTLRSNEAAASVLVRDELMESRAQLLGRVVRTEDGHATKQGLAGVALYLESGSMVVTDARGFFRFEGVAPGAHVVQIDTATLPRNAKVVAPANPFDAGGEPGSRVVEVAAGSAWNVEFLVALTPAAVAAKTPESEVAQPAPGPGVYQKEWIEHEAVSQEWVLPAADESPPLPVTRILVKHLPAHRISVALNGEAVNPLNFNGTATNLARTMAVSMWNGVNLREGDNTLEIVRKDAWGIERGREKRVVHFASPPVRAEFVAKESRLAADGLTGPVLVVRLLDATGRPARQGVTGTFTVSEPYAARRADPANVRLEAGASPAKPTYVVGDAGLARLELEPTMTSGTVRVRLALANGPQEIRADLLGDRKEWILLGLAEGSAGYAAISGHVEGARADDLEPGTSADGRIAFFAKGRIRGGWLLTAAYDSAKQPDPLRVRSLHGKINPDAYYTVYGDQSSRMEAAPTLGKLYVKLERETATALLGDFSLDWSSMAFTTYARELHGAKIDYRGKRVRASVFQSDAGMSAMREEIRGDGTSGPFRLNYRNLAAFGERVVLQERDRDQPEVVVEETALTRNVDYVLDYEAGTLRLSRPLFSVSSALRPLYVVVSYELEDAQAGQTHGGRVELTPTAKFSAGATAINERHDGKSATVVGVDGRVTLGKHLSLKGEVARSENESGGANAYRGDLAWRGESTDVHVYLRQSDPGFGLGQLNAAQVGDRQLGVEVTEKLGPRLTLRGQVLAESDLTTGETRRSGEAQMEYCAGAWTLRTGVRAVRDERLGGEGQSALLATAGLTRRGLDGRLEISLDREQSLTGPSENPDYPERTTLGVSYALTPKVTLTGVQEWTESTQRRTAATLIGLKSAPWAGGQVTGGVAQRYTDGGGTTLSTGMEQKLRLSPQLELDGGFQKSQVVAGSAGTTTTGNGFGGSSPSPFHSAGGFATAAQTTGDAAFVGVHWKPGAVKYDGRIEISETKGNRRAGMLASAQIEPGRDLGLLCSAIVSSQSGGGSGGTSTGVDVRLGLAWRPVDSGLVVLNRLDVVHGVVPFGPGRSMTVGGALSGTSVTGNSGDTGAIGPLADPGAWKVIDNFQLLQSFGDSWQGALHLGTKRLLTKIDDQHYSSWTSLAVLEIRRALGPQWEVGLQGGALEAWGTGTSRISVGLFVSRRFGHAVTTTLGFNARGFRDDDFTAARYTSPGVYVRFRVRFDQNTVGGLLRLIGEE